MTKSEALYNFWSSFGWGAINEQSEVDTATARELGFDKKRIEFEDSTGDYTGSLSLTASLYHYSSSWEEIKAKAEQIKNAIGYGGYRAPIDGGYIWIKCRNPFTNDRAPADTGWRRIVLNIEVFFLTSI